MYRNLQKFHRFFFLPFKISGLELSVHLMSARILSKQYFTSLNDKSNFTGTQSLETD